jgi:hydroxymethylbilane synthase
MDRRTLIIGTRGSQLAVWQAEHIAERLRAAWPGLCLRLERIRTTGDKILDVPLAQLGGKALFVKEIEEALLDGRVDLAVHSMKDVPTELPPGLIIAATPEREDPADVLISRTGVRLADLPRGARVGTSSLRRQAQLLHYRADLTIVGLRGNLDTRIRKLNGEGLDAIVLAAAGVKRLGLVHLVTEALSPAVLLPAVGQGALGVEIRESQGNNGGAEGQGGGGAGIRSMPSTTGHEPRGTTDEPTVADIVKTLNHRDTHLAVRAEQAMLRRLGGGCQVPIAACATLDESGVFLRGLIASVDGGKLVRGEARGEVADPEAVGTKLAEDLLSRGAWAILDRILWGSIRG